MKGPHVLNTLRWHTFPDLGLPLRSQAASVTLQSRLNIPSQTASFSTSSILSARGKKGTREKRDSRIKLIRYHLFHPLNPRPLRLSRIRYLRHWTIHRAWHLFRAKQRRAEELSLQRQYQSMYNACEALRLVGEDGLAVQDAAVHGLPGTTGGQTGQVVRPPGARDPPSRRFVRRRDGLLYAEDMMDEVSKETEKSSRNNHAENRGEVVEVDVAAAAQRQKDVGRLFRIAMEKKGVFQGVPIEYARIQTDTPPRAGWDHDWTRPAPALT